MILDGPLKCETTASQLTIEVVGKLLPNLAYFKFADFRIYQEREISEHVVRIKFKPDSMTLPFVDDSLQSTVGLTPASDYKHAYFELIGRSGDGSDLESIHYMFT